MITLSGKEKKKKSSADALLVHIWKTQIMRSSFWTLRLHILDLISLDALNSDEVGPSFQTVISAECKITSTLLAGSSVGSPLLIIYFLRLVCFVFLTEAY